MKKKLNCILLIDDNKPTNFLHELVIKNRACAEKVVSVESGQEALDFLTKKVDGSYEQPDLIFLDINMPGMNGWEFLEKYKQLNTNQQGKVIVVMLTTSINPDDMEKAKEIENISDFMRKPLTPELLESVLVEYFSDQL
jgi:CheY-like chemotaxis protein